METRRVLISVYNKEGIVEFARGLASLSFEILSTGGTAALLRENDVSVTDVSEYTNSPEILGGRLKTLHPRIHGGILGRLDDEKHTSEMRANEINPIELVIVNLYPFEDTVSNPDCTLEAAIENIDIGGPTMVRAAAKNYKHVGVIVDPSDYSSILSELKDSGLSKARKFGLAKKAFAMTARYDDAISTYLGKLNGDGVKGDGMPETVGFLFERISELRYGENPHQKAAFYKNASFKSGPSLISAKQLHGKALSYNNIMDADSTLSMVLDFLNEPFACFIVKHTNPCGAAISKESLSDAFAKALSCDPISAFGSIVGLNRNVDEETARAMSELFLEVIIAPSYDANALDILTKKKNLRLLEMPDMAEKGKFGFALRDIMGGCLIQERDDRIDELNNAKVVTKRQPTVEEMDAMKFAWRMCKHVKSNAILFASNNMAIGVGAGQMSRLDSARLAVTRAQSSLKGSVVASDAFFPFRDGVDEAAKAGATAIVQPGGSIRDKDVIAAADELNMAMIFTGTRHFKH